MKLETIMKIYLDTCDINEIKYFAKMGMVDGITTNPTLVYKSGQDFKKVLKEICKVIKTSVSSEVVAKNHMGMLEEAANLLKFGKQITIKVPMTWEGLQTCKILSKKGIKVNVTLCFTPAQALLAAKAGATYVSPFIGRLDDVGENGIELIKNIKQVFSHYPNLKTKILAASIRNVNHVIDCAKFGADVATIPAKVMHELIEHPLTAKGLKLFDEDWAKTGQKI